MSVLSHMMRRIMPFALVCVFYEVLEILLLMVHGVGGGGCDDGVLFWACDLGASFLFCILPYLCYLLVLPRDYHGGRWDRICTLCLFALFVLLNGAEELCEVLSGAQYSFLSARFFQDPGGVFGAVASTPGAFWGTLGMLVIASLTVLVMRRRLIPEEVAVPPMWQRAAWVVFSAAAAFCLLSLPDGIMNTSQVPEIYRDGMISFFGDLIAMTAVPDLTQIYRGPVLKTALVLLALAFLEYAWRIFLPRRRSFLQLLCSGYNGLCSRYGTLRVHLTALVVTLLCLRFFSLGTYPLMDTTEARYAEMARKMIETGNWLQPQFDYGIPFWGKPPLSFWGSAVLMKCFGISETSARLAPFLVTTAMAALFCCWPFRRQLPEKALACAAVFLSSVIGIIASGAVMTDAFLALGTTLSLLAFWRTVSEKGSRYWGYLIFVGLAIGVLSKGPLALVLSAMPVFFWALLTRSWGLLRERVPVVGGTLLLLALTVPWYWAAECRTPGFLRYFIIGEHFQRYLVSGWDGDLYGAGHSRAIGTIWLYALEAFLPWTLLLPFLLRIPRCLTAVKLFPICHGHPAGKWGNEEQRQHVSQQLFLWCWALCPLAFFTVARNILPAYVLPAVPAWCLLLTLRLWQSPPARQLVFACVPLLALFGLFLCGDGFRYIEYRCQRDLLQSWDQSSPLYYAAAVPYSAQFYSQGRARFWSGSAAESPLGSYLAVEDDSPERETLERAPNWQCVARSHRWLLFQRQAP